MIYHADHGFKYRNPAQIVPLTVVPTKPRAIGVRAGNSYYAVRRGLPAPVLKFDPGQARSKPGAQPPVYELRALHVIHDNRAAYTGPLQGDRLRDCHAGCPRESSYWQRDHVAIVRRIVQSLHTRRRTVRMVNSRPRT